MTECSWCGLLLDTECPQPAEHELMHRQSETTWRREAQRRMVTAFLQPDEVTVTPSPTLLWNRRSI
jgi:hypothetical protein